MNAPQQRDGQAADALRELQQLASMYDHVAATEGKFVAGELRALATRLQIAESSAPPAPSVGGWMPIETAPHAQEVLLGWFDWAGDWLTEVSPASWGWRNERVSNISKHGSATHWMPLPKGPSNA